MLRLGSNENSFSIILQKRELCESWYDKARSDVRMTVFDGIGINNDKYVSTNSSRKTDFSKFPVQNA